jgi:hypothetical protein
MQVIIMNFGTARELDYIINRSKFGVNGMCTSYAGSNTDGIPLGKTTAMACENMSEDGVEKNYFVNATHHLS